MSLPEVANLNEISSYHQQKLAELRKMPRTTIRHIFRSVSAPRLEEIEGEYYCELLHQGGPIADWFIKRTFCFFSNNWGGKAFRYVADGRGEGYNWFCQPHGIVRTMRMQTYLEIGTIAEGPSLIVDYRCHTNFLCRLLRDEIRELEKGLFIGFGCVALRFGKIALQGRTIPFSLVGPIRPAVDFTVK